MEGEISRQSIMNSLSRGKKASGDLIPWTISEQVGDLAVHLHPGCISSISWSQSAQLRPLNRLFVPCAVPGSGFWGPVRRARRSHRGSPGLSGGKVPGTQLW